MIDVVFKTVQTVLNKENRGNITPDEFDFIANKVQLDIFHNYFTEENLEKNRLNKGLSNTGYSNLPFNTRQRITQFAEQATLTYADGFYTLPPDLYFIEDNGILVKSTNRIVEEVERSNHAYLAKSSIGSSVVYPTYERLANKIKVFPSTLQLDLDLRYLRIPKSPKWTYTIIQNTELFDSGAPDFQDFELHPGELPNIVNLMLTDLGITLREEMIIKILEEVKEVQRYKQSTN
jgi:hypothetical protein